MLRIAAVIPCYNGASFLGGAISSVLAQSYPVSQIVVIDDASTDNILGIVESYTSAGYPIRYIRLEQNSGPATARNVGIAAASEQLIGFLDADDRWEVDHCASLVSLLEEYPNAVLAFGRVRTAETHSVVGASCPDATFDISAVQIEPLQLLLADNILPQSAVIARREAIDAAGGYTPGVRYSEDYDLWLRMAHGQVFVKSDKVTCVRGVHPHQATHQSLRMYRGAWEARARYHAFASSRGSQLDAALYRSICEGAYERDLTWAWQSRSFRLVRGVLALSPLVPGGWAVRSRWRLRLLMLWPFWRVAASVWDVMPVSLRDALRRSKNLNCSGGRKDG